MKRFFPALIFFLALVWLASSWLPPRQAPNEVDLAGFGKSPVLVGGRIKHSIRSRATRSSSFTARDRAASNGKQIGQCNGSPIFFSTRPWLTPIRSSSSRRRSPGLFGWEQSERNILASPNSRLSETDDEQVRTSESASPASARLFRRNLHLRNAWSFPR